MGRMKLLDNVVNNQQNQVEGFCIVKSAVEKVNVKGSIYLDLILSDVGGDINGKMWDYDKQQHSFLTANAIVKVRATINIWKDTEQLKIDRIRLYSPEIDYVDMSKLIPSAPVDGEVMYDMMHKTAEGFRNKELSKLVVYMLEKKKDDLIIWPAALKLHHAYRSGLLYHTFTMLKMAKGICECYTALNKELVYAGIILHDLAKMEELTIGELGMVTGYGMRGQLLGHLAMGVADIELAAKDLGLSDELKTIMQHMVLSHHSTPEYGSPKPPMTPEAEVVSTVDMLDAKLFAMFDTLDAVAEGGFSERLWSMENRMLYKTKIKDD